ncbi:MAG: nucleotidyltransferase family protein [bacterium]|nr:nucleotidyltransferase family protein [bacterium]
MSGRAERSTVAGVVLAAGTSTRLASEVPKQLLELGGEPLVRRAVHTALASRLLEVVVVLGHDAERVQGALAGLDVRIALNPDFRQGQSTSVRAGLAAISPRASAALFVPADQPGLSSALVDRLIEAHEAGGKEIALPVCQGRRGAPVLFGRPLFGELERLEGDTGGRALLPRFAREIAEVTVDDPLELADVDTLEDLEDLRRLESTLVRARSTPD